MLMVDLFLTLSLGIGENFGGIYSAVEMNTPAHAAMEFNLASTPDRRTRFSIEGRHVSDLATSQDYGASNTVMVKFTTTLWDSKKY